MNCFCLALFLDSSLLWNCDVKAKLLHTILKMIRTRTFFVQTAYNYPTFHIKFSCFGMAAVKFFLNLFPEFLWYWNLLRFGYFSFHSNLLKYRMKWTWHRTLRKLFWDCSLLHHCIVNAKNSFSNSDLHNICSVDELARIITRHFISKFLDVYLNASKCLRKCDNTYFQSWIKITYL